MEVNVQASERIVLVGKIRFRVKSSFGGMISLDLGMLTWRCLSVNSVEMCGWECNNEAQKKVGIWKCLVFTAVHSQCRLVDG